MNDLRILVLACLLPVALLACGPASHDEHGAEPASDSACEIDEEILTAGTPVLLHFTSAGTGTAAGMTAVLQGVESDFGDRLTVVELDVDRCPELAERHGVRSVPTVVLLRAGQDEVHVEGWVSREHLDRWLSVHGVAELSEE